MLAEKSIFAVIAAKREEIQHIRQKSAMRAAQAQKQQSDEQVILKPKQPSYGRQLVVSDVVVKDAPKKNAQVSDTDIMLFEKKFLSFLTHKEQILGLAEKKRKEQRWSSENALEGEAEYSYANAEQMMAAYNHIVTGTHSAEQSTLYCTERLYINFRNRVFQAYANEDACITKHDALEYLYNEPCAMLLYGLNPYLIRDQLMQFETKKKDCLDFAQFTQWLLLDRPQYKGSYDANTFEEAKNVSGKCCSLIAKYIGEQQFLQQLLRLYESVDVLGNNEVQVEHLIRKIKRQYKEQLHIPVVEVVNINKGIPLSRLLYQLQYSDQYSTLSLKQFQRHFTQYRRLKVQQRDTLLTKLVVTGKEDASYVFVVSNEVVQMVKRVFNGCQKYAEYFVRRDDWLKKVMSEVGYNRMKGWAVRAQGNQYVRKETVEETLGRIYEEADEYCDLEEIIDFFTSRGRPMHIEQRVVQERTRLNVRHAEEDDSEEDRTQEIKEKQRKRKISHLQEMKSPFQVGKVFNITVPIEFGVDKRGRKQSIRGRRVKEMIVEKEKKEMYVVEKPRQVPTVVKQPLYEQMLRDKQRARQQRLDRFRQEIETVKVSERLTRKKQIAKDKPSQGYKFVARPMPWYCEVNLLERIEGEKQSRRENILEQVILRHSDYDLPEGVKKMIQRDRLRREKTTEKRTLSTQSYSFIPHITHQVPNFPALHEQLQCERQQYRESKEPIHIEPFSFENRTKRSRTVLENQQNRVKKSERQSMRQPQFSTAPVVRDTKKYQDLVLLRKRQELERQKREKEEAEGEAVRKMRQVKFAPIVREALRKSNSNPSKSRAILEERLKEFRKDERKKKADYQDEMIRIYTKVLNRPLLIEGNKMEEKKESEREEVDYQALRRGVVERHQPGNYEREYVNGNNQQYLVEDRPEDTQDQNEGIEYGAHTQ